ncbi:Fe-S cluster assembly sulfur transfer protein SufU [Clostridium gasigenes]|uniref:Modular FeS cluster scaffolding protein NifU n=1 Tax=Clostridium gasigenes TaxID=94869 RepID=A0A1H0MQ81_9CLOT|nr:SUF system NifU family Fe-S cluster assembly protein [Clostridium gasigenes]MBB6621991.1 SUF system NifU family Fe-S cluster assembly protein [Clostridium gasigenes]MBB6716671.1 SUF system NifU family Fe-S cluster assembly protein [Clostridium gasigenes]MBU3086885.1 SUF system NifU family Fe-S cluster assembly protein [Clostridium gasigenes]MBU3102695.1 SUF system NifU family Fe-S cluster assembly protein [Clostridium gasigenes]MBU3131305.1 SUF system NifU family Fe-S cluster assembly prote
MDLNSIYTELIMEHSSSKHNRRSLENPNVCEKGHNPSCGDEISLELKFNGDIIEDMAFTGQGCAISQASTSIMIDLIKGKNKEEAMKLVETFIGMIKREITDDETLEVLEDAFVFKNISNMPARVKCAVIAWHTLKEAIK